MHSVFPRNDLANTCNSKSDLVAFRNWGTNIEVVATKGGRTAFRYMTDTELQPIRQSSGACFLSGGRTGETYFTKDHYKSASKDSQRMGLENTPTLRVEFEILNNPTIIRSGRKLPLKGLSRGVSEFMTIDPVKVRLINWQPLR